MSNQEGPHALCAVLTIATLVVMAGLPLQALAPHADLAAHEFISELERARSVAGNGAVAQPDHLASIEAFELNKNANI